jgi:hypothetical protein
MPVIEKRKFMEAAPIGRIANSEMKTRWWMHRDQKIANVVTDTNAYNRRSYQSSLYLADSVNLHDDSFVCCPGSHRWADADGWVSSSDRQHVSVPASDPRVQAVVSKLIVKKGEMVVWDSRLAHMGGYLAECSTKQPNSTCTVRMLRLDPQEWQDTVAIKLALETDGVVLIKDVANTSEMDSVKEQLRLDIASIYAVEPRADWKSYASETYGRTSKGGGSWGAVCCSQAVWNARLLPRRVAVFKSILDHEDLVVSIDSVHWSVGHPRLSVMASFCRRDCRPDDAYKIKCVAQAYGLTRTTHWAHAGDVSGFNYGADRDSKPQARLDAISSQWRGFGCKMRCGLPDASKVSVKGLKKFMNDVAKSMTCDEATALLEPEVCRWL